MELKDFVTTSLLEIVEAVEEAQRLLRERDGSSAAINPEIQRMGGLMAASGLRPPDEGALIKNAPHHSVQNVEFDVVVSTSESTDAKLGGKITVIVADIGTDKNQTTQNQVANRLRFAVPIALPASEMHAAKRTAEEDLDVEEL